MINIAICDDETVIAGHIEELLLKICKKEHIQVNTDVFYEGESLNEEITKGTSYDIIYLDIQMEGADGIMTARQFRKVDQNALLIYVSGYDKYWMELFRFDVFAFVKKPIEESRFEQIFLEAVKRISSRHHYFVYQYKNEEHKLPCMDILYFESTGRKIRIVIHNSAPVTYNGKLSDVEEQLDCGKVPFLRIHQSYLVNYHHIRSRSRREVTLTDGTRLPISQERRREFGDEYSRLLGGEIDV